MDRCILINLAYMAFPNGSISHERWNEVNGLADNAVEEFAGNPNVELIETGNRYSTVLGNQTYFLARIASDYIIFGRICDAAEGSTYSKYAVIHKLEEYDEEVVEEYSTRIKLLTQ